MGQHQGGGLHHETSLSRHQQLLVQSQQQQQHMDSLQRGSASESLASDPYGSGAFSTGLATSGGSGQLFPVGSADFAVCSTTQLALRETISTQVPCIGNLLHNVLARSNWRLGAAPSPACRDACALRWLPQCMQGRPPLPPTFPAGMPAGDVGGGLRADSAPANYAEQQQRVRELGNPWAALNGLGGLMFVWRCLGEQGHTRSA